MKRILSAVLAAVMAFTIIAVPSVDIAIADDTVNTINEMGVPATIAVEGLTVEGLENEFEYTGKAIKPSIVVTYNGVVLNEGTDYTVTYANNINPGTATLTITTTEWVQDVPFVIASVSIVDAVVKLPYSNYTYTGKARKPEPTVTLGDKVLVRNQDYIVKYTNNVYPGTATVTIEGINIYGGTVMADFYITKMGKLSRESRTATSIKLSWAKKSGVTGYEIEKSLKAAETWETCATVAGDVTNANIKTLAESTQYDFRIRAYVEADNTKYYGEYSPVFTTTTKPGKVEFSSLTTNLKMQLKLKWAKEAGDGYQIYVARNSKFKSPSKYTVNSADTLTKTIKAKKNNQTYYVKVRAYTMVGNSKVYGNWSKVKKIKTDGTGWGTSNDRKYYYKNGTPLKGTHTISGSQYFFGKNSGVLLGTSSTMYNTIKNKKSETKYLISVDRRKNRTVVYHKSKGEWVVKYYWKCSTGAPSDYSKISCTPSGSFSVPKKGTHQKYFGDSHGYRCWYTTRIYKGYLFHSVLYQPYSGSRIQDGRLGYNISHGCIRLSKDNAYWLYKNIKPGTRVEILK